MRLTLSFLASLSLVGCIAGDDGAGDDADDTGGIIDSGDDTEPVDHGTGAVNGTVTVQLYEAGTDDDINEISWSDYGGDFPFGAIYVAAYTVDETTNETTYWDEYVISAPTTTGDAYSLNIDVDDTETVYVYAALDWWPDGVIGTTEPTGLYGELVAVVEGGETNDVDIVISSPLLPTGGGGGTYVYLEGDVGISETYGGGDGKVLIYGTDGVGPYYTASFTPTATADGAEASFSMAVGADVGEVDLLGAWDDDMNGLIDPTDAWGAYVVAEENANPVNVGSVNTDGYTVLIPFGLPPALTPFVRLEGAVRYDDDFSTLAAGTTVYVAALRTRPSGDFGVADLGRGYDWMSFTGAELTGTSLDYTLVTPSNAIAYVWAYADTDGDGLLNEAGEPVASIGRSGRVSTGMTNSTGLDMAMTAVVE